MNIEIKFLGKDSVEFHSTVEFSKELIKGLIQLAQHKKGNEMLFPQVSSIVVNKFLSEVVDGISAKVFRTAYGSSLLAENLKKEVEGLTVVEKVAIFNSANLVIAKKLNHQKNIGKNQKEQEVDIDCKIKDLKKQYKELRKKNIDKIYSLKKQIKNIDKALTKDTQKQLADVLNAKITKLEKQLEKLNNRIVECELKLNLKKETKDIALGTSKTSYSSPKIVVSWCKDVGVPLEKIYSKTLISKFEWALDTDKDYYKKYPNVVD